VQAKKSSFRDQNKEKGRRETWWTQMQTNQRLEMMGITGDKPVLGIGRMIQATFSLDAERKVHLGKSCKGVDVTFLGSLEREGTDTAGIERIQKGEKGPDPSAGRVVRTMK